MRGLTPVSSYRLTRQRTNETTPTGSTTSLSTTSIQTSYEGLKQPEARQKLRDQVSDTFRDSSADGSMKATTPLKERFTRRTSTLDMPTTLSAKSSTSTVNSEAPRKNSGNPDDGKSIDLERAIALLQELKKTASPDELVALHRALLPTKDVEVVASPQVSSFEERASFSASPGYQRRSNLPPGLATRGGIAEDLLRKQGEASTRKQTEAPTRKQSQAQKPQAQLAELSAEPKTSVFAAQKAHWLQHSVSMYGSSSNGTTSTHTLSKSISSIAALDLADDNTIPIGARATTPLESPWSQSGGYRPGTLHITNGAASPEPSLRSVYLGSRTPPAEMKQREGYFASTGGASIDVLQATRNSIDVLPRRMSAESLPIRDRILSSSKAQQQRKDRANRLSGMSTSSKESLVSQMAPQNMSTKLSRQSLERDCVSPMSEVTAPRFQQRWSHRASHISAEYVSDCDVPPSPFEEKSTVMNFASRLSTVFDSDGDDDADDGTPSAALARLTGDPEVLADHAANVARSMGAIEGEPSTTRFARIHQRPPPPKADSGYASDHGYGKTTRSFSNEPRKVSGDVDGARKPNLPASEPRRPAFGMVGPRNFSFTSIKDREPSPEVATPTQPSFPSQNGRKPSFEAAGFRMPSFPAAAEVHELQGSEKPAADVADVQSLYTLEEILKSSQGAQTAPTSPQTTKSKKPSLLRLHTLKAEKRSSLPITVSTGMSGSTDSVATVASTQLSPEAAKAQHIIKQQRKLQKAMPADVKKKRKEEMRKLKAAQQPDATDVPPVSEEVSARLAQRLSLEQFAPLSLEPYHASDGSMDIPPFVEQPRPEPIEQTVAHPDTDVPEVAKEKASRSRSKSRDRGRRNSTDGRESSPEANRSWGLSKLRSKSASRTRAQTPKRSSFDIVVGRSRARTSEAEATSPGDENVPAWTDFSSVAQSLGSGSYDIATNQTKRTTATAPGATLHQLQSPYMISTGLNKVKATKGMNSEAASELARMKSRDFAEKDQEQPPRDRPRIAFPKRGNKSKNVPYKPTTSVEDRFPGWQSKQDGSPSRPNMTHRPHSMYAESIPPMPELPADAAVKASKADVLVAKKLASSSPGASARNSQDAPQEVVTKVTTTVWHANTTHGKSSLETIAPAQRGITTKPAAVVNVQVRELAGSGSEQSSMVEAPEEDQSHSPNHESQHPGWPSWESQAKAWRQRRESLGAALGRPMDEASVITADSPPVSRKPSAATLMQHEPATSPSIVVSRYITPLGAENAARASARPRMAERMTDSAVQRANVYRDLITDADENRPAQQDVPRTDSAVTTRSTTATFVTVKTWDPRPIKQDVPRTNSSFSTDTYSTMTTTSHTTRNGQGRSASGSYTPYSPIHASVAERSRLQSLAKLNGEASNSSTSLGTHHSVYSTKSNNNSTDSLTDRYSGGLQYGWDRSAGFSGSAGTRHSGSEMKKSVRMSENFGLDLSDVPVFLQRLS
ncbi:hypothetical protein LTR56_011381 [Elasticomyces elasticus]|nr:hypothetical protein LTR56_011381 [Elasticomyces elasticus]KAK3660983.1 hypothetical protein LTR22_007811 [Elasticomyces elasticus]KAK4932390.1 hypothetical protein LTR49_001259 [Elasticomyces elasticus]KAK5768398.1 hypothetical protein LTS12_001537 [Elasticomyces elasticus]